MLTITGKQWNDFVHEPWPDDWWLEDLYISVNGKPTAGPAGITDTDEIRLIFGSVYSYSENGVDPILVDTFEDIVRKRIQTNEPLTSKAD